MNLMKAQRIWAPVLPIILDGNWVPRVIPSTELTYPLPNASSNMIFPFPVWWDMDEPFPWKVCPWFVLWVGPEDLGILRLQRCWKKTPTFSAFWNQPGASLDSRCILSKTHLKFNFWKGDSHDMSHKTVKQKHQNNKTNHSKRLRHQQKSQQNSKSKNAYTSTQTSLQNLTSYFSNIPQPSQQKTNQPHAKHLNKNT